MCPPRQSIFSISDASAAGSETQRDARHSATAAEIDELHVEAADRLGFQEHFGLELARGVPGRLPAHGGVEREDQPATSGVCRSKPGAHAIEERIDLGARGGGVTVARKRRWRAIVRRFNHVPTLRTVQLRAVAFCKMAVASARRNGGGFGGADAGRCGRKRTERKPGRDGAATTRFASNCDLAYDPFHRHGGDMQMKIGKPWQLVTLRRC